jgi:SNF2 family DNA or RNA helicase
MLYLIQPWKHQLEAIEKASLQKDFAFLFEMGGGKTCATINTLRFQYTKEGRILKTIIFCPIIVCENWRREFKLHSKVFSNVHILKGSQKERIKTFLTYHKESSIFICNYESLQMEDLFNLFYAWMPEILVCDESQKIKNYKAKRTKAIIQLGDVSKHNYILTGTPILNTSMDIWAQYRFLDGGETFGKNFFIFRNQYFWDKNAGMPAMRYFPNWIPKESTYKELQEKIYKKGMRVLKKDCLDLPPLVKQKVFVELGPEQSSMYQQMKELFVAYLGDKACTAQIALTKSLRLQQIISGFFKNEEDEQEIQFKENPRNTALYELLEDIAPNEKVIVWACFRKNYEAISNICQKLEIPFCFITGGMTDKARQKNIDDFNNDPTFRVMIANQGAGGVGVNLTSASCMIYYSRSFSLEHDLQSEARAYRGGSEIHEKITRIDIVAPETIDELVLEALYSKQNIADKILEWRTKL